MQLPAGPFYILVRGDGTFRWSIATSEYMMVGSANDRTSRHVISRSFRGFSSRIAVPKEPVSTDMNSLKFKILGLIAVIAVAVVVFSTWITLGSQKTLLHRFATQTSQVLVETIHNSIIGAMESGQTSEVIRLLEQINSEPAIESVHIFDAGGRILLSTTPEETGDLIPSSELLAFRTNKISYVDAPHGRERMNTFRIIDNKPQCFRCHGKEKEILGILNLHLSLDVLNELQSKGRNVTILASGGMVVILILAITAFFFLYIDRPIRQIAEAMQRVEHEDYTGAITHVHSSAEMALLSSRFNRMVERLQELIQTKLRNERELVINQEKLAHHEEITNMNLTLEERLKEIEFLNISLEERIEEIEEANFKIADLASELEGKNTTLEKAVERLSALHKVGLATNSIMDLDRLFDLLIRKTMESLDAVYGYILLLDREQWAFNVAGVQGVDNPDEIRKMSIPVKPGGISHWVIVNSRGLLVPRTADATEFTVESRLGFTRESVICAPLVIKDETIGTITMSNKSDRTTFTAEDLSLLSTIAAQASVAINNSRLYEEQKRTYLSTVHALVTAVEASDPYTRGHSERVTQYSVALGQHIGLDATTLTRLEQAAILHDIGKIGIDVSLLHKKGKLDKSDLDLLRRHPGIGERILEPVSFLRDARKIVVQHHERFDGKGYPNGLSGSDILLEAKIIAVADTYDAMTSDRPYRAALSHEVTLRELQDCAGSQFDPAIVDHFVEMCQDKGIRPRFSSQ